MMTRNLREVLKFLGHGAQLGKIKRHHGDSVDLWDFSTPETCQYMLDDLVQFKSPVALTGQELYDALASYDAYDIQHISDLAEVAEREDKKSQVDAFVMERIDGLVPALANFKMLDFMMELWPMMDTTKAKPDMLAVKKTVLHYRTVMNTLKTATPAQIQNYDPATDPNW